LRSQTVRQLGGQILPLTGIRVHIDQAEAGGGQVDMVWPQTRKQGATWAATGLTVDPLSVELHTILAVE
jgi:hypothetical protein